MKEYAVFLMPDAISDLQDIYDYVCEKSGFPERAWVYVEKLRKKCMEMHNAPLRGQARDDLMNGLRIAAIDRKTVMAFLVKEKKKSVIILNIFYGGRDYETLIAKREV